MLKPINDHVLIELVEHDSFIASQKESYEEIGIVIRLPRNNMSFSLGDKVYFDSWLTSKFPKEGGGFYWLVPLGSIKAYESPTT